MSAIFCPDCGREHEPRAGQCRGPSMVGRTLPGGLSVLERLGETSVGPVYRAEYPAQDSEPRLEVALVILQRGPYTRSPPGHPAKLAPLWNHLRRAARIDHPNVAALHGWGETWPDGLPYVAVELVPGEPLSEVLTGRGGLALSEAVDLFVQTAAGLKAARHAGIIGANLSPNTILVTRSADGRPLVKLTPFELISAPRRLGGESPADNDFGAAYASPERVTGRTLDERSAVFSLGALLHHLLTGVPPRLGTAGGEMIPAGLHAVVSRALAAAPAQRFQTIAAFVKAVELATRYVRGRARARTRRTLALGAVAATLALGVAALGIFRSSQRGLTFTAARAIALGRRAVAFGAVVGGRTFAVARRNVRLAAVCLGLALGIIGLWHFRGSLRHLLDSSRQQLAMARKEHPAARSEAMPQPRGAVLPARTPPTPARRFTPSPRSDTSLRPTRPTPPKAPKVSQRAVPPEPAARDLPTPRPLTSLPVESGRLELGPTALLSDDSVTITPTGDVDSAAVQHAPRPEATQQTRLEREADSGPSTSVSEALKDPAFRLALDDVQRLRIATEVHEPRPGVLTLQMGPGLETVSSARYSLGRLFSAYAAASVMTTDPVIELWRNGAKIGELTSRGLAVR